MAITIRSRKALVKQGVALVAAVAVLGDLLALKGIKTRIEKKAATKADARFYTKNKARVWRQADKAFKAALILLPDADAKVIAKRFIGMVRARKPKTKKKAVKK